MSIMDSQGSGTSHNEAEFVAIWKALHSIQRELRFFIDPLPDTPEEMRRQYKQCPQSEGKSTTTKVIKYKVPSKHTPVRQGLRADIYGVLGTGALTADQVVDALRDRRAENKVRSALRRYSRREDLLEE